MKKQLNIRRLIILAVIIILASAYSTIATTLAEGVFSNVTVNPDPIKLGSSASLQYTLSEASTVSITVYKDDGSTDPVPVRNLLTNANKSATTLYQSWDGKDNNGVLVPDGRYRIFLEAKSGETVKGQVEKIVMAARSPIVSGLSDTPDPFNPLNNEQATFNYTISSDAIVTVTILKGTTPVRNFITTQEVKPAGTYTFSWDGKDDAGNYVGDGSYYYQVDAVSPTVSTFKGTSKSTTTLEKDAPAISGLSATPDPLKLSVNSLSIGYTLSENAKVTVKVLDSNGNFVKLVVDGVSKNAGYNSVSWNGQNTSNAYVPEGVYTVEVSAIDNFNKLSAVVTKSITAGYLPAISNVADTPDPFNPSAGEKAKIDYSISKDALVTVGIYKGTTLIKTLAENVLKASGTYSIEWDGKGADGTTVVADGSYTYQIDAVSPTVAAFKSTLKGTTTLESLIPEITGLTVSPDPLKLAVNNLSISYTLSEDAKITINILDSTGKTIQTVQDAVSKKLGYNSISWNGKDSLGNYVPEGIYTVSVAALDNFNNPSSVQTKTFTAGYYPTVSGATVTGSPFNANPPAEGESEKATINYSIAYPAKVTVTILKSTTVIRTLTAGVSLPAGPQTVAWDGKDNSGAVVGDGDYSYQIEAVSPTVDTFKSTFKSTVTVEGNDPSITDVSILPNPVKVGYSSSIRYNLSEAATLSITIKNAMGIVRTFDNITKSSAGSYSLSWDTKDNSGNPVPAGNYTLELTATDKYGKSGSGILLFQVGTTPIISDLTVTPPSIDVQLSEKANITYNVSTDSAITINFYDSKNVLWNTIYRNVNGTDTVIWDGVSSTGSYKVDNFTFTISAVSVIGNFNARAVSGAVSVTRIPLSALSCTECHVNFPTQHPMTNCVACHGNEVDSSGGGHGSHFLIGKACTTCHNEQRSDIPFHPADIDGIHITTNNMTTCSECHKSSLISEHTGRINRTTGSYYDCNTCHNSTRPEVQTAIDNGDTNCFSCHEKAEHSLYHNTYIGQDCKTCHDKTNPTIDTINIATAHTERGMKCEVCHNSIKKNVQDAIKWGQRACSNCHTAAHGQTLTVAIPGTIPQYTSLSTAIEWLNPISLDYWAGETWVPSDVTNGYLILTKRYTSLSSNEVFDFYINKMSELGWNKISGPDTAADKFELVYTQEGKKAYIRFYNTERYNTSSPLSEGYRIEILYK